MRIEFDLPEEAVAALRAEAAERAVSPDAVVAEAFTPTKAGACTEAEKAEMLARVREADAAGEALALDARGIKVWVQTLRDRLEAEHRGRRAS